MNIEKYLKANTSVIDHTSEHIRDLGILDSDLDGNVLFLLGENHGVHANVDLKMKFLEYFKRKINFKYYLSELPYSMTCFLNEYLENGDEGILKDIYKALKGTDAWNMDEYKHWRQLYKFNNKLAKVDRISIVGIDIEHQPKNAFKYIGHVTKDKKGLENINRYVELSQADGISDEGLEEISRDIRRDLEENKELYKDEIREEYFKIRHISNNLLNRFEVYSSNNFNGVRDEKMYENFLSISKYLKEDKYFGQIGLSHIFQRGFPYENWFGAFLSEEGSKFKNKIVSIAYAYTDSKYLYPTRRRNYISSIDTLDLSVIGSESFRDNKYSLIKLNGEDSPFDKSLIWPLSHKFPEEGVTTDYFQYLLIINGSEEMKGFEII